jgi:mannose-6-phosphate isomerase
MKTIGLLDNTIQFYAWGSATAIPDLLDAENPSDRPWAELWMGAHPKAPSLVNYEGRWQPLNELIQKHPHDILGPEVAEKFHHKLPYLFKVLAAAKPLSIQAHPNLEQAREGFERENAQNIPLDAPNRNYKDDNHKPECICALSEFYALHGFRPISEIVTLMTTVCPVGLIDELASLKTTPDSHGLKKFYTTVMTMSRPKQKQVVDETLQNLPKISDQDSIMWMKRISEEYPSDISILSPILLNLVCLKPGQALFLPAGELHAYLEGLGIELMANSDNVLRGGLTPKHIDLPELLRVVQFEPHPINILKTAKKSGTEKIFINPASEFVLSLISVSAANSYLSSSDRSVEILWCADGEAWLQDLGTNSNIKIKRGNSVIIPAAVKGYTVNGNAAVYKAAVPLSRMTNDISQ